MMIVVIAHDYEAMIRAGLSPAYARVLTELTNRHTLEVLDFCEQYKYAEDDLERHQLVTEWLAFIEKEKEAS
jgi:hypothetical protein